MQFFEGDRSNMNEMLTHLSLFSGIGGLDLAAEWAGFRTIGQCEWADFPRAVLAKHWPTVPRWGDIRQLTKEDFYAKTGDQTVTLITGGFPCQPFSTAGKRAGRDDDRYLWPEMLRVVRELRPAWILGENVAGLASMALDDILSDLENSGYSARAFLFPAHAVGAPHRRDRFAIVAHANGDGWEHESMREARADTARRREINPDQNRQACPYPRAEQFCRSEVEAHWGGGIIGQRVPSEFCRVADGLPGELDRLRSLGNAVVPQQFYPIFAAISEIELKNNLGEA